MTLIKQSMNGVPVIDASTPAVVLKLFHHLSLGIVRSLGRLGIPVYGIDMNPHAPGLQSVYCRDKFLWDVDNAPPEATIDFLLQVGKRIGRRSILYNTADETAVLIAQYYDVLKKWYMFPCLSPEFLSSLTSKKEMYFMAKKHNIPTAETLFPCERNDVVKSLESIAFPVMLKGIDGQLLERRTGKKMVIVRTAEELLYHYDRMEDPKNPNLMLQEYIPGGDDTVWMFNGYFNEQSDCLFAITGKKIRQAPVYTGYTSLGICLRNETVEQTTKDFMKKVGYRGILDIGYRYDKRDGKYKVLDINPRVGATFRLFVADNGLDVVRVKYLDLTGQPVPKSNIREGRKWFVEDRDIVSSVRYYRDGKITIPQWIRSFRGVEESAWFAADDPYPFAVMCSSLVKKALDRSNKYIAASFLMMPR